MGVLGAMAVVIPSTGSGPDLPSQIWDEFE